MSLPPTAWIHHRGGAPSGVHQTPTDMPTGFPKAKGEGCDNKCPHWEREIQASSVQVKEFLKRSSHPRQFPPGEPVLHTQCLTQPVWRRRTGFARPKRQNRKWNGTGRGRKLMLVRLWQPGRSPGVGCVSLLRTPRGGFMRVARSLEVRATCLSLPSHRLLSRARASGRNHSLHFLGGAGDLTTEHHAPGIGGNKKEERRKRFTRVRGQVHRRKV